MTHQSKDEFAVGVVVKPHGVKGLVKVHAFNPRSQVLQDCNEIDFVHGEKRWRGSIRLVGKSQGFYLIAVDGTGDREQAEQLRGAKIIVDRATLEEVAPMQEGEYFYSDLIDCQVFDQEGSPCGIVHNVFEAGASDVLVIRNEGRECYVPMIEKWILSIDLNERKIQVRDFEQWDSWSVE